MNETSSIVRHSLSRIKAMRDQGENETSPDAPEAESLGAEFWSSARVVMPEGKTSVHLRLDNDVVDWFKANGKGHLTRMNAVLRAYVEAQNRRRLEARTGIKPASRGRSRDDQRDAGRREIVHSAKF